MVSALLFLSSYYPVGASSLGWLFLVPLLLAMRAGFVGWRTAWLGGAVVWGGSMWWLGYVTPVGAALLLVMMGGTWVLWFVVAQPVLRMAPSTRSRDNIAVSAALATLWVGVEGVCQWIFGGLPWNPVAVSQTENLAILQLASLGGTALVSWLMVFVNGIVALSLVRLWREISNAQKLKPHLDFSLTMALLGGAFLFGVGRVWEKVEATEPKAELRFAALQGNIPQDEKFDFAASQAALDKYAGMTRFAAEAKPSLILWPETATGATMFQDRVFTQTIAELSREAGYSLLLGVVDYDGESYYNAAMLFGPKETGYTTYHKQRLIPFGEFLPGRALAPWLARFFPLPLDYQAGSAGEGLLPLVVEGRPVPVGVLICFEDLFAERARQRALSGALVLVNLTNDGWFRDSPAAWQHARHAVFRAVETGLPLIRCTNTGVTCQIDRYGRMREVLVDAGGKVIGAEGFLAASAEIRLDPPRTFYVLGGWLFSLACQVILGLGLVMVVVRWWCGGRAVQVS